MTNVNKHSAPRLPIRNHRDIQAIEATPLADRIGTWDVAAWLWKGCAIDPQKAALHAFEGGEIDADPHVVTYEQLRRQSIQVANALHGLGVGKADAVVCLLPNIAQFYPITFGSLAAGIIVPAQLDDEPGADRRPHMHGRSSGRARAWAHASI